MKRTVIIAENNLNWIKKIFNILKEADNNIEIIGLYDNENETLQNVKKYEPDFLILDLNLPEKNVIDILEEIEQQKYLKTKVIIIAEEISMINRLNLIKNGIVLNIFIKPFKVQDLYKIIKYEEKNDNIKEKEIINEILHKFKFNFTSQFYEYLIMCIEKFLYKRISLNSVYNEIANEQNISAERLKWGIQKLIVSMNRYTPSNIMQQYIPYTLNPSVKTFIYEIAKRVEKELK